MAPELPQEILDQVVDHLWDDWKALIACNAASRVFVPAARTHIFRDVIVDGLSKCDRFERVLDGSPAAARYVRKLKVVAHHFSYQAGAYRNIDSSWVAHVPDLVDRFPRLIELELNSLNWNTLQLTPERTRPFLGAVSRLSRLVLSNVHFGCSSQIEDVLHAAAGLTELICDRVYWTYWSQQHSQSPPELKDSPERPPLRRLVLHPGSPSTLLTQWLLQSGYELKIQDIDIRWRERGCTDALGDLLRATGVHLESLSLDLPRPVAAESLSRNSIDLSANPSLRHLQLGGPVLPDCCNWVPTLVAQITSTQIASIDVLLMAPWCQDLHAFDWVLLNCALSHPRFAGVRVTFDVCLAMWQANNYTLVHDLISNALPDFRSRGELVVRCA
ncbi:uncharacterized protein C8Q71DRAFT_243281 [Rhodofomes roseus]|uniref:F-box domain-containing protein n=1 Tax=Rhodofomes roseus TaxID=34475 RepID=A0ABQ8K7K0_9APHY|nr:uncharacterized protein C8Q71DRAFT_243281 [Rhodofomes roseus]KAH9832904.1 hypothetical protein C8Q71DRAFT_243281 [Rhodofomes roseus]